jgi:hypothetical protein
MSDGDDLSLHIEFCGERYDIDADRSLTFGRRGDLIIDDNPYLHRQMGRFVTRQSLWWLQNIGSRISFDLRDEVTGTRLPVPPGQQVALAFPTFAIQFQAGPTQYEILGQREVVSALEPPGEVQGTVTIEFGVVPLSSEQHLLLVALCENRMVSGSPGLPTNQTIAARLGWTMPKFNRKLDHLCAKLAREGVKGLRGSAEGLATDRRSTLIDHAIKVKLVQIGDLKLLAKHTSALEDASRDDNSEAGAVPDGD